jgi:hypothetical protein
MTNIQALEQKIIGKVWTSPEVYANVERLCDLDPVAFRQLALGL